MCLLINWFVSSTITNPSSSNFKKNWYTYIIIKATRAELSGCISHCCCLKCYKKCSFFDQASSLSSTIQLRVVSFTLEDSPNTDYVKVYDGPDSTYTLIGTYYGSNRPPAVIESSSNWMNVVFKSDDFNSYQGFNFTYQIKGELRDFLLK